MISEKLEFSGAEGNRLIGDLWDGKGHPVIFLHGGGQTRRAWGDTASKVARSGMRALAMDLRGHGDSDWAASGRYSFAEYGADAAAIARQVTKRFGARPSIVGASLGGLSGLYAEMHHGPLLESLILVDVAPRMDEKGVAKVQGFMGERLENGFATLDEAADAIARYLPNRKRPASVEGLRKNLRLGGDGRYRWHWDPAFINGAHGINFNMRAVMEGLIGGLPGLQLPVLLVRGMQSELVHEDHAREFVELTPGARYVDVGGAGHMVAGDRNDIFSRAVLDFLGSQIAA